MSRSAVCLCILAVFATAGAAKVTKLPKIFQRCSAKSPPEVLNECLRVAVQDGHTKLQDGNPTINVVKLDPLTIPELRLGQQAGPVSLNVIQKNLKIYGLATDLVVRRFHFDPTRKNLGGEMYYSKLRLVSDQEADGRILLVPIKGKGEATTMIYGFNSNFTAGFETYTKNGYTYLKFDEKNFEYALNVEKMTNQFSGLFNGDKALGEVTNRVLNDNWKLLFNEMKPIYEETFRKLLIEALNRFFGKVPLEEVLLDMKN